MVKFGIAGAVFALSLAIYDLIIGYHIGSAIAFIGAALYIIAIFIWNNNVQID